MFNGLPSTMTKQNVQTVYVHDRNEIMDDGQKVWVPSLNTHGEIQNREQLAEAVSRVVDLDGLANEVGKDIGEVELVDGDVENLSLYDWVIDQYGHKKD